MILRAVIPVVEENLIDSVDLIRTIFHVGDFGLLLLMLRDPAAPRCSLSSASSELASSVMLAGLLLT